MKRETVKDGKKEIERKREETGGGQL